MFYILHARLQTIVCRFFVLHLIWLGKTVQYRHFVFCADPFHGYPKSIPLSLPMLLDLKTHSTNTVIISSLAWNAIRDSLVKLGK